ncbi:MAG: Crp/Fnr family transcriptional regulator [Lawsonibacter sp.]
METNLEVLCRCLLFRELPEKVVLNEILPVGRVAEYAKNTQLIASQERVNWFGVILKGRVQILQTFSDGERSLMDTLGVGSIVGADLICTRSRRSPYFAIVSEDAKLMVFGANCLMEKESPLTSATQLSVMRQLMTLIAHENMRKHYRIAILSQKGLRDRILTYLTMQAVRRGTNSFTIPYSREELATYLCVNRSALSHELKCMERENLIYTKKNKFILYARGQEQCTWS